MADIRRVTPERNEKLKEILKGKKEAIDLAHQTRDTERYYSILVESIEETLQDKYRKNKAPRTKKKRYLTFCARHNKHPDIPQLRKAMETDGYAEAENLITQINREHWRDFLANARLSDISGM